MFILVVILIVVVVFIIIKAHNDNIEEERKRIQRERETRARIEKERREKESAERTRRYQSERAEIYRQHPEARFMSMSVEELKRYFSPEEIQKRKSSEPGRNGEYFKGKIEMRCSACHQKFWNFYHKAHYICPICGEEQCLCRGCQGENRYCVRCGKMLPPIV